MGLSRFRRVYVGYELQWSDDLIINLNLLANNELAFA